ncbi:protein NPGR2 isoform X1 [Elaeis guineensis]|uniref:protein NPGR2 isoform X1 n=1 Tax=Elaeis guineensis var. tenera TaxID=51953 RepID=A0A6J0PGR6_ELAGV|nr:protein NPGR2 isoform X1 [Elaeis guineensis]XP_019705495.1 protein NPGR2 isoform X1 [Elaeis guineensis]XP_019705497.1 protein NPGR2 isoform X1 [Elaeis guineensis]XP_019705498.1 protein NPGR2 isoform X1 [Elaeis guineensis]XP_019705499.1 protein NPGR2 isoform X1 [Elaeis guineensis]XP_019705500.1 protein NPGR2 isoform X1 [Elaeis guineensis]XP_019705501.1 protein NPGR2 isoform X1 [Elaeis guineensis]XP_019705502.1 protein NPGR2 isoform X1 [Elaeis guineensis]XP_019705503.1 protein NPGR2 isofor
MHGRKWKKGQPIFSRLVPHNKMKCLCSGEQLKVDEMIRSSESVTTKDLSASGYSSQNGEGEQRLDTINIEEAESSLREGVHLNYEEARALLGRLEYQRGNTEAALRVFDGIDIAAIAPKIKISISKRTEHRKFRSHWDVPLMSIHAVSLLVEAIYFKARALQDLGRFKEAAQTCNIILDTVESASPEGLPENFTTDCKLQETVCKAVELLPELWKLAGFSHETISSYRRALLGHWNLNAESVAKIQKEFVIILLYGGCDASPPNLRSQMDGSFIPRNNIEEAILLLMILLRKFTLKRIEWDPSIIDHLIFALSISGQLNSLASQIEELLPRVLERKERYYTLALCYLGEDDNLTALSLLKKLLSAMEDPNCVKALLLASKVCGGNSTYAEEGVSFARRALSNLDRGCDQMESVANCLLGISLSSQARSSASDSERVSRQNEALEVLERAERMMLGKDHRILFNLCLENAEQRKLDAALRYAKQLLKLEAGSNVKGWILLARILSAQKRFVDAETIVNAALDQTGKWSQGELLRTKAKVQIAQGKLRNAVDTYTHILATIQLRTKSFSVGIKSSKGGKCDRSLEIETWHDLANIYISMSQWRDAEVCLSKLKGISPYSAFGWHATGKLYEAKGLLKEALGAYTKALDLEPTHVASLVSIATVLRQLSNRPMPVVRGFLTNALQLDRTDHITWFNLGLLYKAEGGRSVLEATECFQAAALLEETAPVEPFR